MSKPPTPMPVAFIICDQVIRDSCSGKWTSVGIFDRIFCAGPFPAIQHQIGIYFRITDAVGEYSLVLDVGRLTPNGYETSTKTDGLTMRIKDRTIQADFGINLQGVAFPEPGRYQLRLLANGDLIGDWALHVALKKAPAAP